MCHTVSEIKGVRKNRICKTSYILQVVWDCLIVLENVHTCL